MENPITQKKIVVFDTDETSLNYKYNSVSKNIQSTAILSIENDVDAFQQNTIIGQTPTLGAVYFKHPYKPNTYVDSQLGKIHFLEEKLQLFAQIVQLLGAKRFKGTIRLDEKEYKLVNTDLEAKHKVTAINGKFKQEEESSLSSRLSLLREFTANEAYAKNNVKNKIKDYNKALSIFKDNNLSSEISLMAMINSRNPENSSLLFKERLEIELSNDYNSLIESAASISSAAGLFKLNASFNQQVNTMHRINFAVEVDFFE